LNLKCVITLSHIFDLLLSYGDQLFTSQITKALGTSPNIARRTMAEFKGLGIVDLIEGEYENSEIKIKLKDKFAWFLGSEFKSLRVGFTPDFENSPIQDSSRLLKEKCPPCVIDDSGRYQNISDSHVVDDYKEEQNQETFECYYCDKLKPTIDEKEYLNHVVNYHNNKPAYPSKADLQKNNLKPQGKNWEI
jgi:hypothetical protein